MEWWGDHPWMPREEADEIGLHWTAEKLQSYFDQEFTILERDTKMKICIRDYKVM
jgi:hypothetical protein